MTSPETRGKRANPVASIGGYAGMRVERAFLLVSALQQTRAGEKRRQRSAITPPPGEGALRAFASPDERASALAPGPLLLGCAARALLGGGTLAPTIPSGRCEMLRFGLWTPLSG